jgi:hypothetical protein
VPWRDQLPELYLLGPGASWIRRVELHSVSKDLSGASLAQLVASIKAGKERARGGGHPL